LTPPSNPSTYASFVSEFVKRYPDVDTIEIWNEPNLVFFWRSGPNATQYGQLLQGAYQAVNTVRASITVVSGGLAPAATTDGNISAYDFVSTLYAGGYNAFFEALGMHPYTYPNALPGETQPWNGWYQMVTQVRPTMQTYGDSVKKIWITEFGAPTGGTPGTYLTEQQQVQQMQSAYSNAQSYSWAGPLLWYSFKDFDTSDKTDRENHFGIVNSNWTKKPAFDTFRQLP
jgi:exo-beta-1,3-glucanase (GH17 family)